MALIIVASCSWQALAQTSSPDLIKDNSRDALAIRVIPNPNHNSAYAWYQRNVPNKAKPSSVIVDGYQAVRDGRTVYVNAANLDGNTVYTNIYIISYNQDADTETVDIFGQIIKNWQFNVSLMKDMPAGKCLPEKTTLCDLQKKCPGAGQVCEEETHSCVRYCTLSQDCATNQYCDSQKSQLIRDVQRLADLYEIDLAIKVYEAKNKTYPQIISASYLPGKSISTWPSWNETFGKALDIKVPLDPVNRLGLCASNFDAITCWDEKQKRFATDFKDPVLPEASLAYVYQWFRTDKSYQLCANFETNYDGMVEKYRCDKVYNNDRAFSPKISFSSMVQNTGEFKGYVRVEGFYDIDWQRFNLIPLSAYGNPTSAWTNWTGWTWYSGVMRITKTSDPNTRAISAKNVTLGNKRYGIFTFLAEAYDIKNNAATAIGTIRICNPRVCGANMCGSLDDDCGGTLVCGDCPAGSNTHCEANVCVADNATKEQRTIR